MTFAEFFQAAWGRDRAPFPWQEGVAELALRGKWPASIGMPTAAGKTALIDIAVFALAMRAPQAARRIFFVVDRRVIVDEAAERADALAKRLMEAEPGSMLGGIARSLREIGRSPVPLMTAKIRGGIPRDDSWTDSPLQPAVICSTVDQVGSCLLFRAYGASDYARPIRAGLAAFDSIIILDEAHTSQPFAQTVNRIRGYKEWAEQPLSMPFTVVEMSATPRDTDAFHEGEKDAAHAILKRRWETEKRAKLVLADTGPDGQPDQSTLVKAMTDEARGMRNLRGAKVIGVIANRVLTARRIHSDLVKDGDCDAILLTGRARPYDRDRLWEKWKPLIGLDRKAEPEKPIFVVATQCIEVGANLSFDALVTEIASIDALEQRFGRLARDGSDRPVYAAIVAQKDQIKRNSEDAVYGGTLSAVWKWLNEQVRKEERSETLPAEGKKKPRTIRIKEEFVPMGVLELRRALNETVGRKSLILARPDAPVLMPAHVDLLCQTSPEPAISPEPAVFLHGPETGPADVQVIWRQDLEAGPDSPVWGDTAAICPPSAAEAIPMPVWAVRKWLSNRAAEEVSDLEGSRGDESSAESGKGPVLAWLGSDESKVLKSPQEIVPGMTIVVPAKYGGCDEWGWNPECVAEVADVGDAVKLEAGRPMLRLHPNLAARWKYTDLASRLQEADSSREARDGLSGFVEGEAAEWVAAAVSRLRKGRLKLVQNPAENGPAVAAVAGRSTFEQESPRGSYTVETPLSVHLRGCWRHGRSFGRDLPERLRRTIDWAAGLHDVGKADPRFQAWLRGGNPVKPHELLAKSGKSGQNPRAIERARVLAGYPKGGRHEVLSVALLAQRETEFAGLDFELLLHLVGSHHGRCRPFAPVIDDPEPAAVRYRRWSMSSDHGLDAAGSGVCERFWRLTRRYGWYGLAYLETLVRLADQRQSEAEEDAGAMVEAANV